VAQVLEQPPVPAATRVPITAVLAVCVVVATASLLLPSTITFDPFTWATWGREIIHLRLSTDGGPAWKPLPVMVDVVLAPLGIVEKLAWLVVARTGGLLSIVMAYRLARRLAGRAAGFVAAAGLLLSSSFLEYLTPFGMSEPLLAGLALLAIERHLDGRYGQAYGLIFACLLLRPEAFVFFLAYSVFLWRRSPRWRPWIVVLVVLLPVLWLLPDYVSSGDWLRSTRRAQMPTQGGPLLSGLPAAAVFESEFNAVVLPIVIGAVVATAFAVVGYVKRRQERTLLALAVVCAGWLVEVALTTQARMGAGDQRYLIVSFALGCVLAGVGWIRLVAMASSFLARWRPTMSDRAARWAVIAVVLAASAPFVGQRLDELSGTIGEVPYQAHKYRQLAELINRAGGRSQILACGPVTSDIYQMPALAWQLGVHQSQILISAGPKGTPTTGNVVRVPTMGTVFRTRTIRGEPLLPAHLGSPDFHVLATTDQWQVLSTCRHSPA
jgi:hypothetical protein